MQKVIVTDEAKKVITELTSEFGKLIFIHSEGCCEGTSPMCIQEKDFYVGSQYEIIGEVSGVPYYMHQSNITYWQHMKIIIDVHNEFGNTFSLESTKDKSFIIQSEIIK